MSGQTRETGAAGAAFGHRMGRGLSVLLDARKLSPKSNEVAWNGKRAVIKSCGVGTTSIGVVADMLDRLDVVLAGLTDTSGTVQVFELPITDFRSAMYPSRSRSSLGGKVQLVRRRLVESKGRLVGRFSSQEIERAAGS